MKITSFKNPIIPNLGVCDPHMHVFNDRVYLYASHDFSVNNEDYKMVDWQIWSSDDFINWKLEEEIKPENTFIGASNDCWATDCAYKNGKYYFYFSVGNKATGVLVSEKPEGGFKDKLGKLLLDGSLTKTVEYDPTVFVDNDGSAYIAFGGPAWAYGEGAGYFIAKLNEDMMSLSEAPKRIVLDHEADDKISINKIGSIYYLSFGSFYATSDNVYGPYNMRGNLGVSVDHGSFFEWNNQWFYAFTIPDPTYYFRATGVCYLHQKENGDLCCDPLITEYGVGQYDALWHRIEAEWYTKCKGFKKTTNLRYGLDMTSYKSEDYLVFPNIRGIWENAGIAFLAVSSCENGADILIYENDENGKLLGTCHVPGTGDVKWRSYRMYTTRLKNLSGDIDLCFVSKLNSQGQLSIDQFRFFS